MKGLTIIILIINLTVSGLFAYTVRAVTRDDGGVSIIFANRDKFKVIDKAYFDKEQEKMGLKDCEYKDMDVSKIPTSREHRGAWEIYASSVSVNNVKKEKIIREDKIKVKEKELLRQQAIDSLIQAGEIK